MSPWHAYETSSGPYPHHTDAESASIPLDQPPTPSKRSNKPQYGHHSLRSRRRLHLLITIALTAAVVVTFTSLKGQGLSNVPVGPWSHLAQLGLSGGLVGAGGVRPLPPNRLLLSTHNQVAWYLPDTDELLPLHEGEVRTASVHQQGHTACCAAHIHSHPHNPHQQAYPCCRVTPCLSPWAAPGRPLWCGARGALWRVPQPVGSSASPQLAPRHLPGAPATPGCHLRWAEVEGGTLGRGAGWG